MYLRTRLWPVSTSPVSNSSTASRRRARRNAGSRRARSRTVSRKSFVSAISLLLFRFSTFASFVCCPVFFSDFDVRGLTLLGAAAEQDDERLTVLAEVNSIAWAPIYFEF